MSVDEKPSIIFNRQQVAAILKENLYIDGLRDPLQI